MKFNLFISISKRAVSLLGVSLLLALYGVIAVQPAPSHAAAVVTSLEYVPATIRSGQTYEFRVNGSTLGNVNVATPYCDVYKISNLDTGAVRYSMRDSYGSGVNWQGVTSRIWNYGTISATERWEYRLFETVGCGSLTDAEAFAATAIGGVTPVAMSYVLLATAATAPATPATITAIPLDQKARVSWSSVAHATSYVVTAAPGGATCSVNAPATTCDVAGLTNATPYTFSVVASNVIADSTASASSAAVSPAPTVAPSKPDAPTATSGNRTASVSWTAPTTGTAPFTYALTASPALTGGASCVVSGTSASCSNLTNGTAYTFTVTATNIAGEVGPASDASVAVTPAALAAPGAPGTPTAVAGDGTATVSWAAPSSGGAASNYNVIANPGGTMCMTSAPTVSCVFSGLTNGVSYTFAVRATNAGGTGAQSAQSVAVSPAAAGNNNSGGGSGNNSAPAAPASPVLDIKTNGGNNNSGGLAKADTGKPFTLSGSGLGTVSTVKIGAELVPISSKSASELVFSIPSKLRAGTYQLELVGDFGTLTEKDFFVVEKIAIKATVAGFKGDSSALAASLKSKISSSINKLSGGVTLICDGSTSGAKVSAFDKKLAKARAMTACAFAKQINPTISTVIRVSPASAIGASARNVKLTYLNY